MKDDIADVQFEVSSDPFDFPYDSGTQIILSSFAKNKWEQLNTDSVSENVEKHFEPLLSRKNLKVVINTNGQQYLCKPFDYEKYEGETIEESFKLELGTYKAMSFSHDTIKIFLRYTKNIFLERPPVFISKNRRIAEVRDLKNFRTYCKSSIWGHPNITGYIDTGNILNPIISRDDFKNDKNTARLFKIIKDLEPEIEAKIKALVQKNQVSDFSHIENKFNSVLNNLENINKNETTTPEIGDTVYLAASGEVIYPVLVETRQRRRRKKRRGNRDNEGKMMEFQNKEDENKIHKLIESPISPEALSNKGIKIRIDGDSEPPSDKDGNSKRSEMIIDEVVIYRKHKDFEDRILKKATGEELMGYSLITYIIGEILVHYIGRETSELNDNVLKNNKSILIKYSSALYALQEELKKLDGESITANIQKAEE